MTAALVEDEINTAIRICWYAEHLQLFIEVYAAGFLLCYCRVQRLLPNQRARA